jgi:hypothetical protein
MAEIRRVETSKRLEVEGKKMPGELEVELEVFYWPPFDTAPPQSFRQCSSTARIRGRRRPPRPCLKRFGSRLKGATEAH